jgi:hypothetical protein
MVGDFLVFLLLPAKLTIIHHTGSTPGIHIDHLNASHNHQPCQGRHGDQLNQVGK